MYFILVLYFIICLWKNTNRSSFDGNSKKIIFRQNNCRTMNNTWKMENREMYDVTTSNVSNAIT